MDAEQSIPTQTALPSIELIHQACRDYEVLPADAQDVMWASDLARRVYTGLDVIPTQVMLDWFEANPHGFSIFKSPTGDRLGNLDILPIKKNTLRRIISGELMERDVTGDCLYGVSEADKIEDLYIESFVIEPSCARTAPTLIKEVLSKFAGIVSRLCKPHQVRRLYAIAASAEGSGLLSCLGFESIGLPDARRDGHQLYLGSMELVERSIQKLIGRHNTQIERTSSHPTDPLHRTDQPAPLPAPSDAGAGLTPELACVLFMDIVAFTQMDPSGQLEARQKLEGCVRATGTFRQVMQEGNLLARPTGDGVALVFFAHPCVAAKCAVEVAKQLQGIPLFGVRMGINEGTVYRLKDINGHDDVSGSGINMAQRVMDCGDSGHILISASIAEALKGTVGWHEFILSIGRRKIKHGHFIEIYNLCSSSFGKSSEPEPKHRSKRSAR